MKGDRERCLAAGMDDYLAKPIQTDELVQTIARLVPDSRLSSASRLADVNGVLPLLV
jgi:CheY-like chemotaxis protein